jgi:hypothetical protein
MSRIDKIFIAVIGCIKTELREWTYEWNHKVGKPRCCIKFGGQIYQTFGYQGTTLKSMTSAGLIKLLETDFL